SDASGSLGSAVVSTRSVCRIEEPASGREGQSRSQTGANWFGVRNGCVQPRRGPRDHTVCALQPVGAARQRLLHCPTLEPFCGCGSQRDGPGPGAKPDFGARRCASPQGTCLLRKPTAAGG